MLTATVCWICALSQLSCSVPSRVSANAPCRGVSLIPRGWIWTLRLEGLNHILGTLQTEWAGLSSLFLQAQPRPYLPKSFPESRNSQWPSDDVSDALSEGMAREGQAKAVQAVGRWPPSPGLSDLATCAFCPGEALLGMLVRDTDTGRETCSASTSVGRAQGRSYCSDDCALGTSFLRPYCVPVTS